MEDKAMIQCVVFFTKKGNTGLIMSEKKNSVQVWKEMCPI